MPPKKKEEKSEVILEGSEVEINKGALHRQLGIPEEKNIPMTLLNKLKKMEIGEEFEQNGKKMKMTRGLKRRVVLGITLKKMKK